MTRLRKMMLEEPQRRNFSDDTIRHYIRTVEDFARHFNRPPDRLGTRHIREYQAYLFQKRKLSSGSVMNRLCALRFFYIKTLEKAWSVAESPYKSFPMCRSKAMFTMLRKMNPNISSKMTKRSTLQFTKALPFDF